jgi:redox-sensitive bicupin YhaK (pirin superfamily)
VFQDLLHRRPLGQEREHGHAPTTVLHPHRGTETITYVLRGSVEHRDSLGNRGTIGPGDIQWMTAGRGIVHQEMPKGDAVGAMHGFQLWGNLPAASKMIEPRYRGIVSEEIPEVSDGNGATVKVIAGTMAGVAGPIRDIVTFPEYFDVTLKPRGVFTHVPPAGHSTFAYVIGGETTLPGRRRSVGDAHVIQFGDGDEVVLVSGTEPLRFLLVSGRPLREPIAWSGPIVMNMEDELREAFAQLDDGTFLEVHP